MIIAVEHEVLTGEIEGVRIPSRHCFPCVGPRSRSRGLTWLRHFVALGVEMSLDLNRVRDTSARTLGHFAFAGRLTAPGRIAPSVEAGIGSRLLTLDGSRKLVGLGLQAGQA